MVSQNITGAHVSHLQERVQATYLPRDINSKLAIALVVAAIWLIVPTVAMSIGQYPRHTLFELYYELYCGIFAIQLIITLFFRNLKQATQFHRLQIAFLWWMYMKLTVDTYMLYYFIVFNAQLEVTFLQVGIFVQLLGVLLMVRLMTRSNVIVQKGHFTDRGKGFTFGHQKLTFLLLIIGGVLGIVFIVTGFILDVLMENSLGAPMISLGFCMTVQYLVSLVIPELYLINKYKQFLIVK